MIVVTGGTGLTGSFVVAELLRRGRAVRVLARSAVAVPRGAEVAVADLRDPDSLVRAARGASGIVHTACTYEDTAVDIAAMRALLAAWTSGPFVFLSSLDVYGFAGPGPTGEDAPLDEGYSDYARGKVACERLLAEAAGGRGHALLRAPLIWGPHPTARRRLVPPRLLEGRPIVLPGVDEAEWSGYGDAWVDVRDLATIVAECLERPPNGALNVATGHFIWHELIVELIRATGSASPIAHRPLDAIAEDELPGKARYAQRWRFSEARLRERLGTIPRRPFAVTVRDTVAAAP
jgi:nucleoside-diphosphate-sugar epimerase